eukprot:TRINITY_DN35004_c0_g1_i2.p1 TRINITY_DN35004_c0_g1~~TRINITY_DN35004_c0_g1_i2.p1  ORF type:complete len:841 (+),score=125.44 TRINITY_DN35004_c0_g1_i2:62-2584(+)
MATTVLVRSDRPPELQGPFLARPMLLERPGPTQAPRSSSTMRATRVPQSAGTSVAGGPQMPHDGKLARRVFAGSFIDDTDCLGRPPSPPTVVPAAASQQRTSPPQQQLRASAAPVSALGTAKRPSSTEAPLGFPDGRAATGTYTAGGAARPSHLVEPWQGVGPRRMPGQFVPTPTGHGPVVQQSRAQGLVPASRVLRSWAVSSGSTNVPSAAPSVFTSPPLRPRSLNSEPTSVRPRSFSPEPSSLRPFVGPPEALRWSGVPGRPGAALPASGQPASGRPGAALPASGQPASGAASNSVLLSRGDSQQKTASFVSSSSSSRNTIGQRSPAPSVRSPAVSSRHTIGWAPGSASAPFAAVANVSCVGATNRYARSLTPMRDKRVTVRPRNAAWHSVVTNSTPVNATAAKPTASGCCARSPSLMYRSVTPTPAAPAVLSAAPSRASTLSRGPSSSEALAAPQPLKSPLAAPSLRLPFASATPQYPASRSGSPFNSPGRVQQRASSGSPFMNSRFSSPGRLHGAAPALASSPSAVVRQSFGRPVRRNAYALEQPPPAASGGGCCGSGCGVANVIAPPVFAFNPALPLAGCVGTGVGGAVGSVGASPAPAVAFKPLRAGDGGVASSGGGSCGGGGEGGNGTGIASSSHWVFDPTILVEGGEGATSSGNGSGVPALGGFDVGFPASPEGGDDSSVVTTLGIDRSVGSLATIIGVCGGGACNGADVDAPSATRAGTLNLPNFIGRREANDESCGSLRFQSSPTGSPRSVATTAAPGGTASGTPVRLRASLFQSDSTVSPLCATQQDVTSFPNFGDDFHVGFSAGDDHVAGKLPRTFHFPVDGVLAAPL